MAGLAALGADYGWAQDRKTIRLAVLHPSDSISQMSESEGNGYHRVFFQELARLGFRDGDNMAVERRTGNGRTEFYAALARDVVASKPDLIVVTSRRLLQEIAAATSAIPVVGLTTDPVAYGLAQSLARPGGNVTGVTVDVGVDIAGKYIELLREAVPAAARIGILIPRASWDSPYGLALQTAAVRGSAIAIGPPLESPIGEAEYRRVVGAMMRAKADGVIVATTSENSTYAEVITKVVADAKLPTVYSHREAVEVGGFMAYTVDRLALYRRMALQVSLILKGEKPAEMPFHQPTTFSLLINLKTAAALGLAIPPALLARADEVIE